MTLLIIPVPFCEWPTIENSLSSGRVREGTEVTFICLAGFSVIGSSLITCQADGKFSNTPECKEIGKSSTKTYNILLRTFCSYDLMSD